MRILVDKETGEEWRIDAIIEERQDSSGKANLLNAYLRPIHKPEKSLEAEYFDNCNNSGRNIDPILLKTLGRIERMFEELKK